MRVGILTDLQGQQVGTITEADDETLSGDGVAVELLEQAPLKTFEDWETTLHHSSYLRFQEQS